MKEPRYVLRTEHEDDPGGVWWYVFDTVRPSIPAIVNGRKVYRGRDRERAQADADWLNEIE